MKKKVKAMFNKLKSVKKFDKEIITIKQLVSIVKKNPQENLINKIRSVEYKSKEYNRLKLQVNCITPHGEFLSLRNNGLIKESGYFYFDIDGLKSQDELNKVRNSLIKDFPISFLCKSVGGKGISFLIKSDTNSLIDDTFLDKYSYIRSLLLDKGYDIDLSAGGLVRKMIISSDEDVYSNFKSCLIIDKELFNNYKRTLNKVKVLGRKERIDITIDETFLELIEYKELLKQIKLETSYNKEIEGDLVIEDFESYKILIPKIILDGSKRRVYIRMINALYYINSNITINQVYSFIHHLNITVSKPPMNEYELRRLVVNLCKNIIKTGDIRLKTRTKKLHFNKKCEYTIKEKQEMGRKLGGRNQINKSLILIRDAREECYKTNTKPTQKNIMLMTGLSLSTVKRNWNKEYKEIEIADILIVRDDSSLSDEIIQERDNKLTQVLGIDEEDFWDGYEPTSNKKTKKFEEDGDFGESDGVDGLIDSVDFSSDYDKNRKRKIREFIRRNK